MANTGKMVGSGVGAAAGSFAGPAGMAIGAGLGGMLGGLFDDNGEEARELMRKALAEYEAIGLPPDLSGPIIYQQMQEGGMLTPALERTLQEEMFQASNVQDNLDTRREYESGLNLIRSKAFGSGYTPEEMAGMRKAQQQIGAEFTSGTNRAIQKLAEQGKTGGGDTLAAILGTNAAATQQVSENATNIGARGAEAKSAALKDFLHGIGTMRTQDEQRNQYNETARMAADVAKMQNSTSRQARNVASVNQTNQSNRNRRNQTNDANINMANAELLRQQQAKRDYWNDKLRLASGKAGAYSGQANTAMTMANNQNQNWNNMFQGAIGVGGALGKGGNNWSWGSGGDDLNFADTSDGAQNAQNYFNDDYKYTGFNRPNANPWSIRGK